MGYFNYICDGPLLLYLNLRCTTPLFQRCTTSIWYLVLACVLSLRWSLSFLITLYAFLGELIGIVILPRSGRTSASKYTTSISQQLVCLCCLNNGIETGRALPKTRPVQGYYSPESQPERLCTCQRSLMNNTST